MNILFALAGLHRVPRGAKIVFESVAQEIALGGEHKVMLIGSGRPLEGRAYDFAHIPALPRHWFEGWPKVPFLRNEFMYEELTFASGLLLHPWRDQADITMTCGYPYTNWALRRPQARGDRPPHVFVTQNGDWPATERRGEPRFFSCEGLICTNPIYFARNCDRWRSTLIPNGIDPKRFRPGPADRARFGLPEDRPIVLMVSALEPGKRVLEAIHAVAELLEPFLVIAGDGPLRREVDNLANELLPGRFKRATFHYDEMPDLYRSADLFLHTKILESFGNVYIEALSSGLSIVAHDDEVTRWILRDYAILVDTRSRQALSRAIAAALRAGSHTGRAAQWAHSTYSWRVVARKYLEFFEDVLTRDR